MAEEDLSKPATYPDGTLYGSRVVKAIRDRQTEIIAAFARVAAERDKEYQALYADLARIRLSTDRRLERVEQRMTAIEKALSMPPRDAV